MMLVQYDTWWHQGTSKMPGRTWTEDAYIIIHSYLIIRVSHEATASAVLLLYIANTADAWQRWLNGLHRLKRFWNVPPKSANELPHFLPFPSFAFLPSGVVQSCGMVPQQSIRFQLHYVGQFADLYWPKSQLRLYMIVYVCIDNLTIWFQWRHYATERPKGSKSSKSVEKISGVSWGLEAVMCITKEFDATRANVVCSGRKAWLEWKGHERWWRDMNSAHTSAM